MNQPITELAMACNDYRNGMHQHRCDSVKLSFPHNDQFLALNGPDVACRVYPREHSGKIRAVRLGHLKINVLGYQTWVGNWCWDEARIDTADVPRLLHYLQRRGWTCEEGIDPLYDMFNNRCGFEVRILEMAVMAVMAGEPTS